MSRASIAAIIPARGGSKGLPRKNVLPLASKPLLAYTIEAALGCADSLRCLVSTEDSEIARISLHYGAEVIDRPRELAADTTLTSEVVLHVLDYLQQAGEEPDYLVLLQPTSPLRNASHLTEFIRQFMSSGKSSGISVVECEHHPLKTFELGEDQTAVPIQDWNCMEKPRQQLPRYYRANGAMYILAVQLFRAEQKFFVEPMFFYPMKPETSLDIDSAMDLAIAEYLIKAGKIS